MGKKVVLAYSGGLDTSVAIKWLQEKYGMEVVTLTIDLGATKELSKVKEKALRLGVRSTHVIDAREPFVKYFIFPALQAGAMYEGVYPLATALGRPLIAKLLAEVAEEEGAEAVAHGDGFGPEAPDPRSRGDHLGRALAGVRGAVQGMDR